MKKQLIWKTGITLLKIMIIVAALIGWSIELLTLQSVSATVYYTYVAVMGLCLLTFIGTFFSKIRKWSYLLFVCSLATCIGMSLYNDEIDAVWREKTCLDDGGHWNDQWQKCIGSIGHCPPNQVWNVKTAQCETRIKSCQSNTDCGVGEYCLATWIRQEQNCDAEFSADKKSKYHTGACRVVTGDQASSNIPIAYIVSNGGMNWTSANRFCQALKMKLVTIADFDCADSKIGLGVDKAEGQCLDKNHLEKSLPAPKITALNTLFGNFMIWTGDSESSDCSAGQIGLTSGTFRRVNQFSNAGLAVCKPH